MGDVSFPKHSEIRQALEVEVESYFRNRHIQQRDHPWMYAKAAIILAWATLSYVLLVFFSAKFWSASAATLSLGLALAAVAFNIQHDGNHGGFSKIKWINRVAGWSLDLMGASSYFWRNKHNVQHHTYTNIVGEDGDLNLYPFARSDREYPRLWFHRYQHLYLWGLYTVIHMRYVAIDFHRLLKHKVGGHNVDFPKKWELLELLVGKLAFAVVAFAVPMLYHRWWVVLGFFTAISMLLGLIFGVVFQLAHLVDNVEHPGSVRGQTEDEFVVHQIKTTADFATRNWLWTTYLGGLNFQREHHLFPRISHVHYPALARIVRSVCARYGISCREHASFWAGIRSHSRFLRQLGQP